MNPSALLKSLTPGSVFYLDAHPLNVYRKVDGKTAEFVHHRLGNHLIGCRVEISPQQWVRSQPFNELLDDPEPPPFGIHHGPPRSPCGLCGGRAPNGREYCFECEPPTEEELLLS